MKRILRGFLVVCSIYLSGGVMMAQVRTITGKVIAASDGLPLPGTTVIVKGTNTAVQTGLNGEYSLSVQDKNAVLVYQFMGFATLEKKVNQQQVINVSLLDDSETLEGITITTGYEKLSKRTFTGSVSKITTAELKVDGVADVSRMIEGKAAGVTVQNVSGTFGSAPKITVRGSSTIMGDTKPLWVIDGVVQEDIVNVSFSDLASGNSETLLSSAIAGLNSNDVESIEILKDASATSIYGSRAMNGVVVITTKSGKRESPLKINYTMENTMRTVPRYSQYDILNSQENMSILQEMSEKGLLEYPDVYQNRYGGVYNLLARQVGTVNPDGTFNVVNNQVDRNAFLQKYEMANTDWFKELFRPSIAQNHTLSFTGGGKNNAYFASIGFYNDPGWSIADDVKRLTVNLKNTFFITDKFNVALGVNFSNRDQTAPGSYNSKTDVVNGGTSRDFDINPFSYALNTSRTLRPYGDDGAYEFYRMNWAPFNVLNELENNKIEMNVKDIKAQLDADYKILPQLTYNMNASVRYAVSRRDHNIMEGSNVVGAYNANETTIVNKQNIFLYEDPTNPDAPKQVVLPNGGIRYRYTNNLLSYNVRNSLSYREMFGDKHELEAFVGTELRSVDREYDKVSAFGLQFDKGYVPHTDPRLLEKIIREGGSYYSYDEERERTVGFFGKASYIYDNRYIVSLTGRYDGSNKQGQSSSSRWLPTWTVSGKWNVKGEKFLIDNPTISNLSLRAAYGLTATTGPATNSYAVYKSRIIDREFTSERESQIRIEDLQNDDLTWEKSYETNIGLDLGLWNNRVQLVVDAYQKKSFDLIDLVTTSGIGGQRTKFGNNADMTTKGIEIGLTTKNIVTPDFTWSTTLNASYYDQKIDKLQNESRVIDLVNPTGGNVVGRPRNAIYSYQFTGLNDKGLPTFIMPDGVTDNVFGANFQHRGEGILGYLKYEGSVEPNKSLGFTNNFKYKNWTLNVFVVASGGNKIRLNPSFKGDYTDMDVFTKDFQNRWINPGDENVTDVPVIASARLRSIYGDSDIRKAYNTYNYSDARIADGGFVRLKDVSLTYEFPELLKKQLRLSNFSLRATASNPWLIYSDKKLNGQDPEFFRSGGVAFPVTTQYSLTLNVGF
ncbi:SusC/RagA family TonB-linked outer membrane protein [Myroides pelagicus]|uniref:SusC/RagA family TonB-linked outer membrane protein n=1 Tax=Myroides pelagicus TaxID=270914 RepID=A0A7K1GLL1_9FLAO|nr:SusC/RagA family TonB-linked outer membrane protein [Myroides pelagicus]MEC4114199.1 SusC/RagA family TonB-linked outer membrane protein [Myroides pelagicus]MTH29757.1 SusC/RagA family TonB-linked outer membrane protein [Myroides pelagicus]